jgi:hypothetical protein
MNHALATMKRVCHTKAAWPALLLAGCVSVKAPDKPIEINLNINVRQEVVVSLKKDADDVINANPELFPK